MSNSSGVVVNGCDATNSPRMSPHIESGEECMQAQNETDYQDKFGSQCAAEVSMEIILLERMRVEEALSARDAVVQRLAEACASISQKTGTIKRLEGEKENLEKQFTALNAAKQVADNVPSSWIDKKKLVAEIGRLAGMFKHLQHQILTLKRNPNNHGQELDSSVLSDVENDSKGVKYDWERSIQKLLLLTDDHAPSRVFLDVSNDTVKSLSPILAESMTFNSPESPQLDDLNMRNLMLNDVDDTKHEGASIFPDPAKRTEARYSILGALPLPSGVPEDVLRPIIIPSPHTLHEFLGMTPASIRAQLGNYRVFQQSTTFWCPEREEHGYFLAPVYKCSTNPRVNTAHRWTTVEMASKLNQPAECFYNRDGKWYYAGVYRTFRMDDLVTQEWDNLCHEATQALIKETLSGRKNVSPQNVYETGQLYAVGALKVACIGLQCIGFNNTLYRTILDHAAKCAQTGKWRSTMAGGGHSPGMTWTTNSNSHSPNAEAFGGTVSSKANEGNSSIQNPLNGGSSGSEDVTLGKINNA